MRPGDGRPLQPFRWWQLLSRSLFSLSLPGADGRQLVPDPRSAAGRRLRLDRDHSALSRSTGSASVVLLLGGPGVVVLELVDVVGRTPPVVDRSGGSAYPVQLPLWLTITMGPGAVVAGTERALRLRYHWLLDGAAS